MGGQVERFLREKEKIALTPVIREIAKRMGKGGLSRGFKAMSPKGLLEQGAEQFGRYGAPVGDARALSEAVFNTRQAAGKKGIGAGLRRAFGAGTHLGDESTNVIGRGLKGGAEELSRRGWTGMSKTTKYLPIGEKAQLAIGTGAALGSAKSNIESGNQGVFESAGDIGGFVVPSVLGAGTGAIASAAVPLLASHFGSKAGRKLDTAIGTRREQR